MQYTLLQGMKERLHCLSAFWLQSSKYGEKINDVKNYGAEVDVFEVFDVNKKQIEHAIHWDGYGKDHKTQKFTTKINTNANGRSGFHTYGVEWTPKNYFFYYDGKMVNETSQAVSNVEQYMIISMEIDKAQMDYIKSNNKFYDEIVVDYVRVYKLK